jgi:hypothetical protein
MDIDYDALQEPIAVLKKEQEDRESHRAPLRWHDLHVKVICGSLADDFKSLVGGVDVIVATEV